MRASDMDQESIIAEINLTPLVDVSLVLVIIFMVVAPFLTHILKPLQLPNAIRSSITDRNALRVSIFPDGIVAVGNTIVAEKELSVRIHDEISSGKKPWALVRAGSQVSHGRVMQIMKVLKVSGIERIAFATQPPKGETAVTIPMQSEKSQTTAMDNEP